MDNKFFVHQIKRTGGTFDKGIAIKDDYDSAKQTYHAYLGAYAYRHDPDTDFVSCKITDMTGNVLLTEAWYPVTNPEE